MLKRAKPAKKTLKGKKVSVLAGEDRIREIERKAYSIWENKGRPENSELDNWLEAERSLN